jgi:hypothetical protein
MPQPFVFGAPAAPRAQPERVGLIAELRSSDCRVVFLKEDRSAWLPLRDLQPVARETIRGSLEETITATLALLSATEMEVSVREGGRCRLIATHGAFPPETIDAVRGFLGGRLRAFLIRPAGMSRIQSIVEFDP